VGVIDKKGGAMINHAQQRTLTHLLFAAVLATAILIVGSTQAFAVTTENANGNCDTVTVVSGERTIDGDGTSCVDLYVDYGATLTVSSTLDVSGNVYIFGSMQVNSGAKVTVGGSLYCLKYNSMLSAGDYDYGILRSSGSVKANSLVVQDYYLSTPIPQMIHKTIVEEPAVEPTCTEEGKTATRYCSACGEVFVESEIVPALGHAWGSDYTVDTAPTCTEPGAESIHCSVCDAIKPDSEREIDAAHTWSDVYETDVEATCTEPGSESIHCGVCGETKPGSAREIPASHAWETFYTVDKTATCSEAGLESIHCSVCDEQKPDSSREIAKLTHAWGDWAVVTEATYDAEGLKQRKCTACGEIEEAVIPVLERVSVATGSISGLVNAVYNGKPVQQPGLKLEIGGKALVPGVDYRLSYENNVSAGVAFVLIEGMGDYQGMTKASFKVAKAANTMKVSAKSPKVKAKALKKKAQIVKTGKAFKVKKAVGTVTYKKVAKGSAKQLKITKTGKITVKKGTKKGNYSLKVKVTAKGDANHKPFTKTVVVKVTVK